MCEALRTLMKDEIDKEVAKGISQGIAQGISQGISQGIAQGISQGVEQEHKASVEKLANNYLETGAASTRKEALKMAKAILG